MTRISARAARRLAQPTAPRHESNGEAAFAMALRLHGSDLPPAAREVEFARAALGRKWRFDFLIGTVGIEVDGGAFAPGGGRHASDADRDKLNNAAALGYRVLRFSPQQIERDPVGCVALVRRALEVQSQ